MLCGCAFFFLGWKIVESPCCPKTWGEPRQRGNHYHHQYHHHHGRVGAQQQRAQKPARALKRERVGEREREPGRRAREKTYPKKRPRNGVAQKRGEAVRERAAPSPLRPRAAPRKEEIKTVCVSTLAGGLLLGAARPCCSHTARCAAWCVRACVCLSVCESACMCVCGGGAFSLNKGGGESKRRHIACAPRTKTQKLRAKKRKKTRVCERRRRRGFKGERRAQCCLHQKKISSRVVRRHRLC